MTNRFESGGIDFTSAVKGRTAKAIRFQPVGPIRDGLGGRDNYRGRLPVPSRLDIPNSYGDDNSRGNPTGPRFEVKATEDSKPLRRAS